MKTLLVSTGSGSQGGGEFYLLILARALIGQGHEVHIAMPDHPRMNELRVRAAAVAAVHAIDVLNTYDRRLRSLSAAFDRGARAKYARLFESVAPDVVHINQQVLEDGLDAFRAAERSGRPFVLTTHVTHGARTLGARFGWIRDRVSEGLVRRSRCPIITVSNAARRVLAQRLGSHGHGEERIHVVYNGVEEPAEIGTGQRRTIRKSWGADDETCVIGVVGRIEEQKNPVFFARLLGALRQRGTKFRAVWIGDGRMRPELEQVARSLDVGENLHIDGWRDDVEVRLQALDVFLLTSKFEGLPFALQEAMLAGLPVCVTAADGMREAIEDGENGFLCPAGNLDLWADRLERLVTRPDLRATFGEAARAVAGERFTTAAMAEGTVAAYREAIAGFRSSR